MVVVDLEVLGVPAPKGSYRAIANKRTGRAILVPSGSDDRKDKLQNWDAAVRSAVRSLIGQREAPVFVDVALRVEVTFRVARPRGHWGTGKHAGTLKPTAPARPSVKPDIDKLARTTLDSMTGSVFDDDSRIAELVARKVYAAPGREGAAIRVEVLP